METTWNTNYGSIDYLLRVIGNINILGICMGCDGGTRRSRRCRMVWDLFRLAVTAQTHHRYHDDDEDDPEDK